MSNEINGVKGLLKGGSVTGTEKLIACPYCSNPVTLDDYDWPSRRHCPKCGEYNDG